MQTALQLPREDVLRALLEQFQAEPTDEIFMDWDEQRRLAAAVRSFQTRCERQELARRASDGPRPPGMFGLRVANVDSVGRMLQAAGLCEAVSSFPLAQLALLREEVSSRIRRSLAPDPRAPWIAPGALSGGAKRSSAELGRILGNAELGQKLGALRVTDAKRWGEGLEAYARLVDQAAGAPDYSMSRAGEHYPPSREGYRRRAHDPWVAYLSDGRHEWSLSHALDALHSVAASKEPEVALDLALISGFLREIGIHARRSAGFAPKAAAIRDAIAAELVLPLRALNETIQDVADAGDAYDALRAEVEAYTKSVVEGTTVALRSGGAAKQTLEALTAARRSAWFESRKTQTGSLTSHEAPVLEVLWAAKIQGVRDAFDAASPRALELAMDGRTKVLVVSEGEVPKARATLQLGPAELSLDAMITAQPEAPERAAQMKAIVEQHAKLVAEAVSLPLSELEFARSENGSRR